MDIYLFLKNLMPYAVYASFLLLLTWGTDYIIFIYESIDGQKCLVMCLRLHRKQVREL